VVAERWVSTERGAHLAGRRKVNTAPEVLLRKAVHAAGGRFRLHRQIAKGCTPDFVLPSRHIAVFVDGCFWHGCPEHGRKTPGSPGAAPRAVGGRRQVISLAVGPLSRCDCHNGDIGVDLTSCRWMSAHTKAPALTLVFMSPSAAARPEREGG
jgi:hypothetical protein